MPLPRLADIEVALLKALVTLGGKAHPSKVYPEVTKQFRTLTPEQLAETLPSAEVVKPNETVGLGNL